MLINKISIHRRNLGITQEQLSEKSGVGIGTIIKAEKEIRSITFKNLEKIANAMNLEVKDLFLYEK